LELQSVTSKDHEPKRSLLWYAPTPAPYRFPVWEELGRRFDLTVVVFERIPPERTWTLPAPVNFRLRDIGLRSLGRDGLRVYVGKPPNLVRGDTAGVIVTGWTSPPLWMAQRWARAHSVPLFTFYESTSDSHYFSRGPVELLRRRALTFADEVLVPGPAAQRAVVGAGVSEHLTRIVGNTIDAGRFLRIAQRKPDTTRLGHTFSFIGRPVKLKNIPSLLRAFDSIAEPDDQLMLAGFADPPEELAAELRQMTHRDKVSFGGFLEGADLDNFLGRTDTLVLPSTREVWGMVAQEALLAGSNVVVSERCGIADSIRHQSGVWVTSPDVDAIATAMRSSRRAWVGRAAREQPNDTKATYFADQLEAGMDAIGARRRAAN
jgi:glycosyltransferase involved in cell wall biosynthesis